MVTVCGLIAALLYEFPNLCRRWIAGRPLFKSFFTITQQCRVVGKNLKRQALCLLVNLVPDAAEVPGHDHVIVRIARAGAMRI